MNWFRFSNGVWANLDHAIVVMESPPCIVMDSDPHACATPPKEDFPRLLEALRRLSTFDPKGHS